MASPFLPAGHVTVTGGLTMTGGSIDFGESADLTFQGNQSLSGAGTVTFNNEIANNGLAASSGTTLSISSGVTVEGNSGVVGGSGGLITNQGTIEATGGGSLTVQGFTNFAGGTLTGGTWEAVGGSTLRLVGANITTNAAGILLDGAASQIDSGSSGTTNALAGFTTNAAAGSFTIQNGANSIGTASPEIQIYKYDLNGDASSQTPVPLSSPTIFDVIDHAIEIDFGAGGIGGKPNTTAADGYYKVDIHLPSGQTAVHSFYRLLGDVNGDGIVDNNDLNSIAAAIAESAPTGLTPLSADVIGSGTITSFDLTLATRSKGHKLGSGLSLG